MPTNETSGDNIWANIGPGGENVAVGKRITQINNNSDAIALLENRLTALEIKLTNIETTLATRFLILESQRETQDDKINDVRQRQSVAGPPAMQVVLAVLMTLVFVAAIYLTFRLSALAEQITRLQAQQTTGQQK